jgi:hypothetical protein
LNFNGEVVEKSTGIDCGRHEDEFDSSRVGVDEMLNKEQNKVHVLLALMNLVQDDVSEVVNSLLR